LGEITNTTAIFTPAPRHTFSKKRSTCGGQPAHAEYRSDILKQMLNREMAYMPRVGYLTSQAHVEAWMRSKLNDWLVEVHDKFGFKSLTLHATINIIDRYLSVAQVRQSELQLMGATAMFIAAKFEENPEEVDPPTLEELVHICDNAFVATQITTMECKILMALDFQLTCPTAAHFLSHFLEAQQAMCPDVEDYSSATQVASYVLELALLESNMMQYTPSFLAGAALLMARRACAPLHVDACPWPTCLADLSGQAEETLETCATELQQLLIAAPSSTLQSVPKKYRHLDLTRAAPRPQSQHRAVRSRRGGA